MIHPYITIHMIGMTHNFCTTYTVYVVYVHVYNSQPTSTMHKSLCILWQRSQMLDGPSIGLAGAALSKFQHQREVSNPSVQITKVQVPKVQFP